MDAGDHQLPRISVRVNGGLHHYDSDNGGSQNHVATIVVAPSVPKGTVVETRFTHYSLLRTEEDILGIASHLGGAATAPGMAAGFHLR